MICDGQGQPLAVEVGPGHQHETQKVRALLDGATAGGRRPKALAGDKAYSAGWVRDLLKKLRIRAVIPHKSNEKGKPKRFARKLYKGRNVVECCFGKLKWLRRVATRYEKLAIHYVGMLQLAMIFRFTTG